MKSSFIPQIMGWRTQTLPTHWSKLAAVLHHLHYHTVRRKGRDDGDTFVQTRSECLLPSVTSFQVDTVVSSKYGRMSVGWGFVHCCGSGLLVSPDELGGDWFLSFYSGPLWS